MNPNSQSLTTAQAASLESLEAIPVWSLGFQELEDAAAPKLPEGQRELANSNRTAAEPGPAQSRSLALESVVDRNSLPLSPAQVSSLASLEAISLSSMNLCELEDAPGAAGLGTGNLPHRDDPSTGETLRSLVATVEGLSQMIQQLNQTVQDLTHTLQLPPPSDWQPGFATSPKADAAPAAPLSSRPRIETAPRMPARAPQPNALPTNTPEQRTQGSPPRKKPEEWSERLQKLLDEDHTSTDVEPPREQEARKSLQQLTFEITAALTRGSHRFRELQVQVQPGGVVVLQGSVPTEHLLHIAAFVVSRVPGVQEVVNRLRVVTEDRSDATGILKYWHQGGGMVKALHVAAVLLVLGAVGGAWNYEKWMRPRLYPVTGLVKFEGELVEGAKLTFHPVSSAAVKGAATAQQPVTLYAMARTGSDGKFTLSTFGSADGAPAGEYRVAIEWRKLVGSGEDQAIGPNILPARYVDPETSGLKVTIQKRANELAPFELVW
jgi:hypothetical protein